MEQRISWWIVSSGERGEIVKRPTSGLIVSGISNWPVAISREETGSTTGSLPSTIPPPPFSLSLSLSRCPLARRLLDSSRELPVVPSSSASRRPLSFFLPLGRSTFTFHLLLLRAGYYSLRCISVFTRRTVLRLRASAKDEHEAGKHFCPWPAAVLNCGRRSQATSKHASGFGEENRGDE